MQDRIPVWLDCDPGHDDAFAILLAAHHPRLHLLGVSTVFGNASLEKTTRNAASLLTALGCHHRVPLHAGHAAALERPALRAPTDIHGDTGLDGTSLLPTPACEPLAEHAVAAMAAALAKQPAGTAWVVATGALTNVAALFRAHPHLVAHVAGVSLMGGSLGNDFSDAPMGFVDGRARLGNVTPFAEFNVLVDPEAAAHILHSPELAAKTTVVPLDLSHQVRATDAVRDLLLYGADGERKGPGKSPLRTMLVELLYFFAKTYTDVFGIADGPPLHDPIAVAAVLIGTTHEIPLFQWDKARSAHPRHDERFAVTVVTDGSLDEARSGIAETGRTHARPLPAGQPGVRIPRSMDVDKFWQTIEECLQRADAANTAATAATNGKTDK